MEGEATTAATRVEAEAAAADKEGEAAAADVGEGRHRGGGGRRRGCEGEDLRRRCQRGGEAAAADVEGEAVVPWPTWRRQRPSPPARRPRPPSPTRRRRPSRQTRRRRQRGWRHRLGRRPEEGVDSPSTRGTPPPTHRRSLPEGSLAAKLLPAFAVCIFLLYNAVLRALAARWVLAHRCPVQPQDDVHRPDARGVLAAGSTGAPRRRRSADAVDAAAPRRARDRPDHGRSGGRLKHGG